MGEGTTCLLTYLVGSFFGAVDRVENQVVWQTDCPTLYMVGSFFGGRGLQRLKPHFMHFISHMADAFLMTDKPLGPTLEFGPLSPAPTKKTYGVLFIWLILAV